MFDFAMFVNLGRAKDEFWRLWHLRKEKFQGPGYDNRILICIFGQGLIDDIKEMKIKHITIDNFRILRHADIDFQSNVNVLIGINGAGKTAILHAARILMSWFTTRMLFKTGRGLSLTDKDITQGEDFCRIEISLDNGIKWMMFKHRSSIRKSRGDKSDLSEMNSFVISFYESDTFKNGTLSNVPMIAYYGVDRAVTNVSTRVRSKHLLDPLDIYRDFGDERLNFISFFQKLFKIFSA